MKWMLKGIRFAACAASSFTILMSPVAQGAAAMNQRERAQEFLKMAGYGGRKTPTIGEFYSRFREFYPISMRSKLDDWATMHADEPMPKVDIQEIKDTEGKPQLRVFFQRDGKSFSVSTGDGHVKINSFKVTAADAKNFARMMKKLEAAEPIFAKSKASMQIPRVTKDTRFVLTREKFARLTIQQKGAYFLMLRRAMNDAERILQNSPERKTGFIDNGGFDVIARWMAGEPAFAAAPSVPQPADRCIVAGYPSTYGDKKLSCGGIETGRADFVAKIDRDFSTVFSKAQRCSGGSFPCNPLVYGFDGGGAPYCISSTNMKYATRDCNKASPLNGKDDRVNRERIVQSWVKAMGKDTTLEFNEEGNLREDQYGIIKSQLDELSKYIGSAVGFCDSAEGQKLQTAREDQKSACTAIKERAFSLASYNVAPPVPPAPICDEQMLGSVMGPHGKCVCEAPKVARNGDDGTTMCAEPPPPAPPEPPVEEPAEDDTSGANTRPEKPAPKEEKDYTWLWILGGVAGLALLDCFVTNILLCKKKTQAQPPVYVPPVPPPFPPPPDDGPDEPVPPPPPPAGETGTGTPPINGGGVNGNR